MLSPPCLRHRATPSAGSADPEQPEVPEQLPDLPGPSTCLHHAACAAAPAPQLLRPVCRSWAAAAAAAPADVDETLWSHEYGASTGQLQDWLAKRGGVVVRLCTGGSGAWIKEKWLQLPVAKISAIRSLDLHGISVSSSSSSSSSSNSSSSNAGSTDSGAITLPRLEKLTLFHCKMTVQLLSQLFSATTLSKLHWAGERPDIYNSDTRAEKRLASKQAYSLSCHRAALWQRLQLLPQLSELKLIVGSLTAADIAPLSNLQHLQHFVLWLTKDWLFVRRDRNGSVPRELLAALKHLTQLRHLALEGLELPKASLAPHETADSHPWGGTGGYQCSAALTASTQLTALKLTEFGMDVPVPQAAFDHMLPSGRVLPHLKELQLNGGASSWPCVDAAAIARIAASCPALQQLRLRHDRREGFDVSCLSQLPPGVTRVEGLDWIRHVP